MARPALQVAFDVGGTFTDVVIARGDGRLFTYKILTIPTSLGDDICKCVDDALAKTPDGEISGLVHGTTIASNAVVEGVGAITGLLTTRGFRDELEIRRFIRPHVTGLLWDRTQPLIPRRRRIEVTERMSAEGKVITPLDEEDALRAIEALAKQGVESIAISFINSYANPGHERRIAEIARKRLPGVAVVASSDVLPEIREYERTSTTAINAFLLPTVARYLDNLENETKRYGRSLYVMQANGGVAPSEHLRRFPAGMIESGPAAGVLAVSLLAQQMGLDHAISFDMGGTTVKACLIQEGKAAEAADMEVGGEVLQAGSGYALRFPGFDLVEIGAGGGSIAWIDSGGALRSGPRSAGAVPGPVCYGRGGRQPTNTDANVVLGYMNPTAIAGGTVAINKTEAIRVLQTDIADRLHMSALDAAYGIHQVANATMMRALRAVTTERGQDPRECTLVAIGGAGPIHAANLAADLEIPRVVLPFYPGLFSALGLLLASLRFDYVLSVPGRLADLAEEKFNSGFDQLMGRATADLKAAGLNLSATRWQRLVDIHYLGQATQLSIPVLDGARPNTDALAKQFHGEHQRAYGYSRETEPLGVLNVRVRATSPGSEIDLRRLGQAFIEESRNATLAEHVREVYFGKTVGTLKAPVLSRAALIRGDVAGPAVIEEFDTTVLVPPGWHASIDDFANIVLRPSVAKRGSAAKRETSSAHSSVVASSR